ncbi:hypothetical protein Forpi1262_v018477 [Fusarium oxysporum f. sp. raphani]|uniref:Uncharacterized protein n=1 Tax=Fusarium oxysporum f. sp. raphani TaxID=96318 RepID=A0A8J5TYA2_FUSOX|nr:hypothetical protein Forpi1262_v018477 [Fusarium oxysporum f. sp. raphani]
MSNNTGPAPPYTGAPPSMAEMMAEIHQMRSTINTLRARVNEQPTASAQTGNAGRDPGEALKPPKPEPFKGQAADVVPFLTRMKGYFRLFQNRLDTPTKKDPQMAIRTQTLGMTRSGYETVPNYTITFVEPEPESQPGRQLRVLTEEEKEQQRIKRNEANSRCYYKRMQDPEKKAHERQKQRERRQKKKQDAGKDDLGEPQTLGIIREGKTIPPKGNNQAQSSKAVDDIPTKTIIQRDGSTLTVDTEKGYTTRYEAPRFAQTTLQKKEEAVKKEREAETKTLTIPGTPNDNPYHEWETYGYSVHHWHENLGVATLRFNLAYYRQIHKTKELLEGIKHSQQLIEEAEKEFEEATQGKHSYKKEEITKQLQDWEKEYQEKMANGQYDHLMKKQISIEQIGHPINWPSTDNASSDTTEELQGQWEDDGLHLRNDPVDLQRLNEITTTEDTDSDESSLEKEHIFEPIDLKKGFDQVLINDEQSGQGITPEDRDAELEEHFQQQLFDEEFINDCPNGEGCNDSECEQTHRDASGKVTRHL